MKATIKVKQEVDIKTLLIKAGVRYWEDSTIDGVEDENGDLTPCREGDLWCPIIDVDSGVITNWKQGVKAEIHFKVCDRGSYYLKDSDGKIIGEIEDNYVPEIVPGEYGDYIIMTIDENGQIDEWDSEANIDAFFSDDDED